MTLLESRLTELESLIIGPNQSVDYLDISQKPVGQLFELQSALSNAEKRPVIGKLLGRVNEIQKYIDPHFMEDDLLCAKSKVEIILAAKPDIEKIAESLEAIQSMRDILNHPTFSELNVMKKKLAELRVTFVNQQMKSSKLIQDSQVFMDNYFNLMVDVSKLFTQWNQQIISLNSDGV